MSFFEIDPLMVQISTDPSYFSYTSKCAKGPIDFVLGDARLTLTKESPNKYDLLLVDAFSSDAVPSHLLTVEAMRMYLTKIKPDGVAILHLSNRNLELLGPAQAAVMAAGGAALTQRHLADPKLPSLSDASEHVVIFARSAEVLAPYRADPRWRPAVATVRPWTDDYTNLVGALVRRAQENWAKRSGA
jgi:spermidine synthase